jgi:hypothetical protein
MDRRVLHPGILTQVRLSRAVLQLGRPASVCLDAIVNTLYERFVMSLLGERWRRRRLRVGAIGDHSCEQIRDERHRHYERHAEREQTGQPDRPVLETASHLVRDEPEGDERYRHSEQPCDSVFHLCSST